MTYGDSVCSLKTDIWSCVCVKKKVDIWLFVKKIKERRKDIWSCVCTKHKDPPLHSLKLHDHPFLGASQLSESISHLLLYQVGICGHINFPGLIGFLHMILDMALCFHSLSYWKKIIRNWIFIAMFTLS